MTPLSHQSFFDNPARLTDQPAQEGNGQCCDNHLRFVMRDNHHEFYIGITTILECLMLAEKHQSIPDLPDDWWTQVRRHYALSEHMFQK